MISNVKKWLNFLRNYEKLDPKYLWSYKDFVDGKINIIWGLLYDIYLLFHNKIKKSNLNKTE